MATRVQKPSEVLAAVYLDDKASLCAMGRAGGKASAKVRAQAREQKKFFGCLTPTQMEQVLTEAATHEEKISEGLDD